MSHHLDGAQWDVVNLAVYLSMHLSALLLEPQATQKRRTIQFYMSQS